MPFRVNTPCNEFGLAMAVGQMDPPLSIEQLNALAVSGLGDWVDSSGQDAPAPPAPIHVGQVEPITTIMLANPEQFGLAGPAGRVFECNGLRYYWDGIAHRLNTLGGLSAAQVVGLNAGHILDADGGVMALSEPAQPGTILTATGLGYGAPCYFAGIEVSAYVGGPQTIAVRNNLDGTGAPLMTFIVSGVGFYPYSGDWQTTGGGHNLRRLMSVGVHLSFSGGTSRSAAPIIEPA